MFTATAATAGCRRAGRLLARQPRRQTAHDQRSRTRRTRAAATGAHYGKPLAGQAARREQQAAAGSVRDVHAGSAASGDGAGAGGSVVGAQLRRRRRARRPRPPTPPGSPPRRASAPTRRQAGSPRPRRPPGRATWPASRSTTSPASRRRSPRSHRLASPPRPTLPATLPLRVKVRDGRGDPLQEQTVTFTLGSAGSGGGCRAPSGSAGAGASFPDGSSQATETTNASGIATSPRFTANSTAGRFASTGGHRPAPADVAGFSLDNRAGRSPTISASGKAKRSAIVGTHYAKPLQVELRDPSGKPPQGKRHLHAQCNQRQRERRLRERSSELPRRLEPSDRSHQCLRHRDLAAADRRTRLPAPSRRPRPRPGRPTRRASRFTTFQAGRRRSRPASRRSSRPRPEHVFRSCSRSPSPTPKTIRSPGSTSGSSLPHPVPRADSPARGARSP